LHAVSDANELPILLIREIPGPITNYEGEGDHTSARNRRSATLLWRFLRAGTNLAGPNRSREANTINS